MKRNNKYIFFYIVLCFALVINIVPVFADDLVPNDIFKPSQGSAYAAPYDDGNGYVYSESSSNYRQHFDVIGTELLAFPYAAIVTVDLGNNWEKCIITNYAAAGIRGEEAFSSLTPLNDTCYYGIKDDDRYISGSIDGLIPTQQVIQFSVLREAGQSTELFGITSWHFSQKTFSYKFEYLNNGGDIILDNTPVDTPTQTFRFKVPFGTNAHISLTDGTTYRVLIDSPQSIGTWFNSSNFSYIRVDYSGIPSTRSKYNSASTLSLSGVGNRSLQGGYTSYTTEWTTCGNTLNVYFPTSDDVRQQGLSVYVDVNAVSAGCVWYGFDSLVDTISGDMIPITDESGNVDYTSGNGSEGSPYIGDPMINGSNVGYEYISTFQNGYDSTGIVDSFTSALKAPVEVINTCLEAGRGFMTSVAGLFSWLPDTLLLPVKMMLYTICGVAFFKALL